MRRAKTILSAGVFAICFGCAHDRVEKMGLAYRGETPVEHAQLLVDETWLDEQGVRHVNQEIFDSVFSIIDEAEHVLLLDFFLLNDFLYEPGPGMRPLSRELTDRLLIRRQARPDLPIIFITDPINSMYGSIASPHFGALQQAGIQVVWTELDQLRDSNPLYSKPWRLLIRPWGVAPGNALQNPLGEGRMSVRSFLKLLNFKANHRKLIVSEKSMLVTSANPHSASSAHWNVALRVDGAGSDLAFAAESAILNFSGAGTLLPEKSARPQEMHAADPSAPRLELLTEKRIEDRVRELLDQAEPEARIELSLFYFSDRDVMAALIRAKKRGCHVRVILDPNKDAFGRTKNGIPNRQTAVRLNKAGIPVRWADTHGEQFHVKMLYAESAEGFSTVLLGSCNFTRRNMENYNAECSAALTALQDHAVMVRARDTFERWWSNPDGRTYTSDYEMYEDTSVFRRVCAWLMESTGLSSF
jgi:phosphatidylserine/phosphatidylglycerophosphate/cardiolipin synthase-like enzyme